MICSNSAAVISLSLRPAMLPPSPRTPSRRTENDWSPPVCICRVTSPFTASLYTDRYESSDSSALSGSRSRSCSLSPSVRLKSVMTASPERP